jgi:hypothetical protein
MVIVEISKRHLCHNSQDSFFYSHDDMRIIHHRDVQLGAMGKYSRRVACLVLFVLRCHQGWDSEYSMSLTKRQSDACQALLDALLAENNRVPMATANAPAEVDMYLHEAADQDDSYDMEELLDDPEDEVYQDTTSLFSDDSPLFSGPTPTEKIAETPIQEALLELLFALYTHLPTGGDDKFWSPILRFIILSSVMKEGQWLPRNRITQIFSALLFCGRLLMMILMHREVLSHPGICYSA